MAICSVACFICGASVTDERHEPRWMGQFRVLFTCLEAWDRFRISGTGKRRQFDDVIPLDDSIDNDIDIAEATVDQNWVQIRLFKTSFGQPFPPPLPITPQPLWGFATHARCWDILCAKHGQLRSHANSEALRALFNLCLSQPSQMGILNWGHLYGGIIQCAVDPSLLLPGEEPDFADHELIGSIYQADPADLPALDSTTPTLQSGVLDIGCDGIPSTLCDPFRIFPAELLVSILIYMPSSSVISLRLASRTFAALELSNKFWLSRFSRGFEYHYVLDLMQDWNSLSPRWKSCVMHAKSISSLPSMNNRKRIWELASKMSEMIDLRLESSLTVKYASVHQTDIVGSTKDDGRRWLDARSDLCPLSKSFVRGSRAWSEDHVMFSTSPSRVSASVISLNGKSYISGLLFLYDDPANEPIQLGYRASKTEDRFVWDDSFLIPGALRGFHVALDARGIRGLRIVSSSGACSNWVGDYEGIPRKNIIIADCEAIQGIKCGLDALKLVSLSVLGPSQESQRPHEREQGHGQEWRDLWYPCTPSPGLDLRGILDPRVPRSPTWLPFTMCLFGGEEGELLPLLSHLTVWTATQTPQGYVSDDVQVRAIEFHYSRPVNGLETVIHGQVPRSGTYGAESHVVNIESTKGERITALHAFYERMNCVFAIEVHTSYGRICRLPQNAVEDFRDDEYFAERLCPQSREEPIVGVYSNLKHGIVLMNLGVACMKYPRVEEEDTVN